MEDLRSDTFFCVLNSRHTSVLSFCTRSYRWRVITLWLRYHTGKYYKLKACVLPQLICRSPTPPCDSISRRGLWKVTRVRRLCSKGSHGGTSVLIRKNNRAVSTHCVRTQPTGVLPQARRKVLTRPRPSRHPQLRPPLSRTVRRSVCCWSLPAWTTYGNPSRQIPKAPTLFGQRNNVSRKNLS